MADGNDESILDISAEDAGTLTNILDIMLNSNADIKFIQDEVSKIVISTDAADAFVNQITMYKQYELLVKYQLDQIKDFLESGDGYETESLKLAEIYTSVQKTINEYTTILKSNNDNAISVKKVYVEVKGRVLRLKKICGNISYVVLSIEQFSFDKRNAYSESLLISNSLIKYPMVKRIPQVVLLTNNTVEFVLPDYFVNTTVFEYELFNNFDADAIIETNSENVSYLKITGAFRGKSYNLIVKATNPLYQNNVEVDGGGLNINSNYQQISMKLNNYTFLTFPIKEEYSPPVPKGDIYFNLNTSLRTITLQDNFNFINDETTYRIDNISVDISNTNIRLIAGMLEITGKNADKEYIITIIATDSRNRDSAPLFITCLDVPKEIVVLKEFTPVVTSSDIVIDFDEYFEHVLNLDYTFTVYNSNFTHITTNNNVMTIGKMYRNITYIVNVTCTTINAETTDQQLQTSFLVREPSSAPTINNASYSTINMTLPGTGIGTSTGTGSTTRLINLTNFFYSTGPINYTINQVNDNNSNAIYYVLKDPMPEGRLLRIISDYRNEKYTLIVNASTESGQTTMTINVTELNVPPPIIEGGGLESLEVDGYYRTNTDVSIPLSTYFSGVNVSYRIRLYYVQNNVEYEITDNRVAIVSGTLFFEYIKLLHNMKIYIQVTADNRNASGELQSVMSELAFHEDIIDPIVTQLMDVAVLSNDSKTYVLSNHFDGVNLTYSFASSVQGAISITNGVMKVQAQYRNALYDVVVTATCNRFDGNVTKHIDTILNVDEDISPVGIIESGLPAYLVLSANDIILLSNGFVGADITYRVVVYTNIACTLPDADHDVSVSGNNLIINHAYRNKNYYVKVSASNISHRGETKTVSSTIKVTEYIQPVKKSVPSVAQLDMTDLKTDYILSDYFTGPNMTFRHEIQENIATNTYITTNSTNQIVLRVVPAFRDVSYNIEVFAENTDFIGTKYIASLVFPVRELSRPSDYVNVISEINVGDFETVLYGTNDYMLLGTDEVVIDLSTYFQNYTSATIGEVLIVPTDSSTYPLLSTHANLTGDIMKITGANRNKEYNVVIRLKDDDNLVFNKVMRISESIVSPSTISNNVVVSPWLTDNLHAYDLRTFFNGILSGTVMTPYVYAIIDGFETEITSEIEHVYVENIDHHALYIVPNFRNMEYIVRVIASNTDHMGSIKDSMPAVLAIREDVQPIQVSVVQKGMLASEPIVYDLGDFFTPIPNDVSYVVLDTEGNIETPSDTDIIIKNDDFTMIVYPNYRNRQYTIQVIGSFPNYTGTLNNITNTVDISETITPPSILKDLGDIGTAIILINTFRIYDMTNYFTGIDLQFAIESIYTVDIDGIETVFTNSDVTLDANILTISNVNGLGEYMVKMKASNTDYMSSEYVTYSTLVVFEPDEISGEMMDTGSGEGVMLLNNGFPISRVVMTNETYTYTLSDYFDGSDRTYSVDVKDANGTSFDSSLVDVLLYKDNDDKVSLQLCANYRDMYYDIHVTCTSITGTGVGDTLESILRIVETVKTPTKINGGLESQSTVLLTDNIVTFDIGNYFGGNFTYPSDAITVVTSTDQTFTDHNVTLDAGILTVVGNYRNTEYYIIITVITSNVDNLHIYRSVSKLLVVETIKPVAIATTP